MGVFNKPFRFLENPPSLFPAPPFCEQGNKKGPTGDQEDNASNQAEHVPLFYAGGDKKSGADHKEDPSPQVEPRFPFLFIDRHTRPA